jgi:hypothetical protein
MDITKFFEVERSNIFNKDALHPPAKFISWETDDAVLLAYFNWIRGESKCASLRLLVDSSMVEVIKELEHKASYLAVPHRSGDSEGWRTITLYGYSSLMSDFSGYYKEIGIVDSDSIEGWTDVCQLFPHTVKWVKENIPFDSYSRVRVMLLEPGGTINPHRDWRGQMLGGGINVAITNPEGVEFGIENGGLIPWVPGDVRMIDVARHHSVWNRSNIPRIHLIISPPGLTWNKTAMQLACKSYSAFKEFQNE